MANVTHDEDTARSSEEAAANTFPPLSRADVLACSFSAWYPTFRKVAPKASIIKPLEDRFIDYLESDRVFIPDGSGPIGISELSDDESGNASDSSEDQSWQVTFHELDAHIRRVITKYDGAVFPKLNWSSPQDAAWMVPGPALKCQSPADVYLLLKSSDFIAHDLDHAFDECTDQPSEVFEDGLAAEISKLVVEDEEGGTSGSESGSSSTGEPQAPRRRIKRDYDFELVLKKWYDMPKSQEWRCFVRDQKLVAISQRDINYYDFLQSREAQEMIRSNIATFFEDEILAHFPSSSYIFDVYFTRSNDRLFLLDFNPYGPQTDSLLFPWSSLHALSLPANTQPLPVLRLITSSTMSSQSMPSFSHNRYPKDVVDLSSGASIAEFAKKWKDVLADGVKATTEKGGSESGSSVGR